MATACQGRPLLKEEACFAWQRGVKIKEERHGSRQTNPVEGSVWHAQRQQYVVCVLTNHAGEGEEEMMRWRRIRTMPQVAVACHVQGSPVQPVLRLQQAERGMVAEWQAGSNEGGQKLPNEKFTAVTVAGMKASQQVQA